MSLQNIKTCSYSRFVRTTVSIEALRTLNRFSQSTEQTESSGLITVTLICPLSLLFITTRWHMTRSIFNQARLHFIPHTVGVEPEIAQYLFESPQRDTEPPFLFHIFFVSQSGREQKHLINVD